MTGEIRLNPRRLAQLEAGGWRAYYDRDWPRLIKLMVQLNQEQFHIPFPLSVVAAFHVARGSIAWAPVDNDPAEVRRHFVRYYRMARRWSGLQFAPRRAAELEIDPGQGVLPVGAELDQRLPEALHCRNGCHPGALTHGGPSSPLAPVLRGEGLPNRP